LTHVTNSNVKVTARLDTVDLYAKSYYEIASDSVF